MTREVSKKQNGSALTPMVAGASLALWMAFAVTGSFVLIAIAIVLTVLGVIRMAKAMMK